MSDLLAFESIEELGEAFPSSLVVMLYDEAISNMTLAIDAIGRGDIEARFDATARTAEIISQLYLALDTDQGGEIADNLCGIYNYVLTQLPQVNFDNDPALAEQIILLLQPIRDSWFELDERIRCEVVDAEIAEDELTNAMLANKAMNAKGRA